MGKFKRIKSPAKTPTKKSKKIPQSYKYFINQYLDNFNLNEAKGFYSHPPHKLTPAIEKKAVALISRSGLSIDETCKAIGVTPMTFGNWKRWGKKEKERISSKLDEAIEIVSKKGKLDLDNPEQLQCFTVEFLKAIKPNRFLRFFIKLEEEQAKVLGEELENIRRAGRGGKYLSETIEEIDKETGEVLKERHIEKYQTPQWGASAWYLERRRPDLFGSVQKIDGNIKQESTHQHTHTVKLEESTERTAEVLKVLMDCGYITIREDRPQMIEGEVVDVS